MEFKYKCNYLFNICFYLILTLFVLTTILIFQKVSSNLTRSILLLLTIILLSIWSLFLKRKLEITKGTFEFTKDTLNYTTLGKTYYIEYNEIEYILKEEYLDNSYLISRPSYQYIIKIKLSYQQFSWDKLIKQRNNPQLRIKKYYYIVLS